MSSNSLTAEREHLANLLEAVQRCAHFLHASSSKVGWPLNGIGLKQQQKDAALFEALAAFNERFAKLQDTLGGWAPGVTLPELVREMVEADYTSAQRDNMVRRAGFQAYDYHE